MRAAPGEGFWERLHEPLLPSTSPLPLWLTATLVFAGVLLLLIAFVRPRRQRALLLTGSGLIAIALVFYVVILILALFVRSGLRGGRHAPSGLRPGSGSAMGSW